MPSQKRRRPVTATEDAPFPHGGQSTEAASPAGFTSLPLQLRQLIVEVACHSSSSFSSSLSPFETDNGTMFNLALVCREINAQVTPLLWGTVAITRPSALYALHQALLASPERAKMIMSLHIGPQDALPSYWWPLSRSIVEAGLPTPTSALTEVALTFHWIATSLDQSLLPSGCQSRQAWRWDRATPGCRGAAIYEALEVIKDTLGLDFNAHGCASPTTIAPVFEAQAALDMYLDRLRCVEEQNPELAQLAKPGARVPLPCRHGQCNHYPALFISGAPKSARSGPLAAQRPPHVEPPSDAFVISYPQLLCHIACPGSTTDRFDHPLALARSRFNVIIDVPAVKDSQATYWPSKASYKLYSGTWDVKQHEVGQWAGTALLLEAAKQAGEQGREDDQRCFAATLKMATFGPILGLARDVVDLTTNVQNLSLTGYLESAILGKVFASTLTRLSIGPALPCWDMTLPVSNLRGVAELRICGRTISTYEAWSMALGMRSLKKFIWSLVEPGKHHQHLADIMDPLLNQEHGMPSDEGSDPATVRKIIEAKSKAGLPISPPLIIARLHHTDIVKLLRTAPSQEIKAAWLAGRLTPGACRRLLVKENRGAFALGSSSSNEASTGSDSSSSPIWEEMYREGREYWRVGEAEYVEGEKGEHGEQEEEKEDEASQ